MYINTNTGSLIARNSMRINDNDLSKAMQRLSTGLRINNSSDDAAGLAISERMKAQSTGMTQAYRNAQDGISLIQTAEGALGTTSDILQRMRELSVQADNGTYSDTDKTSIKAEMDLLVNEIDHISQTTSFNGMSLLNADTSLDLHISDKFDDTISVSLLNADSTTLGVNALNVSTDAQGAISAIDDALNKVSSARADLGATQSRLNFISDNLQINIQNTEASKSRISDADMAEESSNLTKSQILSQSSLAMLGKANQAPQGVLQLLQG
ncbi:flagellin [Priestia sp. SB1]|uniref:flagellin N-terminal helical domain-containing protein n=1 Tax=Priestia sp. SB1 TaxID=3132359 RepID=UPI003171E765